MNMRRCVAVIAFIAFTISLLVLSAPSSGQNNSEPAGLRASADSGHAEEQFFLALRHDEGRRYAARSHRSYAVLPPGRRAGRRDGAGIHGTSTVITVEQSLLQ